MKNSSLVFAFFILFFAVSCDSEIKFENPNDINSDAYQGNGNSEIEGTSCKNSGAFSCHNNIVFKCENDEWQKVEQCTETQKCNAMKGICETTAENGDKDQNTSDDDSNPADDPDSTEPDSNTDVSDSDTTDTVDDPDSTLEQSDEDIDSGDSAQDDTDISIPDDNTDSGNDSGDSTDDADSADSGNDSDNYDIDGDGLPDNQEVFCENLGIHSNTKKDTDGDGDSDLAEIMVGSDPCNASEGVKDKGVKFYFELPYNGEKQKRTILFSPQIRKADIFFNVDTTGSMGDEITNLKQSLSNTIIPEVQAKITDSAFGVSYFDDFPVSSYGNSGDMPFGLLQSPTTDTVAAQNGVNNLTKHSGGDGPESGYESLYKIATGVELSWDGGYVAAGEVGFRPGAIPIVFHITDAAAHDSNNTPYDSSYVYTIFDQSQVINAMNAIGAKVVSVVSKGGSTSTATSQLTTVSNGTGAKVPDCADVGKTTLLYTIESDGSGLDSSAVNGVDALIKYASFDVKVKIVADHSNSSFDTSCFLKKVEAMAYIPVDECASTIIATPAEFNGAGFHNGFSNFSTGTSTAGTPGNKLRFNVEALNNCFPQTDNPEMFKAYIKVVEKKTNSVLDSQTVTIIVPAK